LYFSQDNKKQQLKKIEIFEEEGKTKLFIGNGIEKRICEMIRFVILLFSSPKNQIGLMKKVILMNIFLVIVSNSINNNNENNLSMKQIQEIIEISNNRKNICNKFYEGFRILFLDKKEINYNNNKQFKIFFLFILVIQQIQHPQILHYYRTNFLHTKLLPPNLSPLHNLTRIRQLPWI